MEFTQKEFNGFVWCMLIVAAVVFVVLFFIDAGYGKFRTSRWGPAISNKLGWCLMESPIFFGMLLMWYNSEHKHEIERIILLIIFELHYFHRAFIFPVLLKGNSKMPIIIMFLAMAFNLCNTVMQGYYIFYLGEFQINVRFIAGVLVFFVGMYINIQSDYIIRHLRKDEKDTHHYLPQGGLYDYVTSANYFGEIVEWTGYAVAVNSLSAWAFALWTMANLVPRAHRIHNVYRREFAREMDKRKLKRVFPFLY